MTSEGFAYLTQVACAIGHAVDLADQGNLTGPSIDSLHALNEEIGSITVRLEELQ